MRVSSHIKGGAHNLLVVAGALLFRDATGAHPECSGFDKMHAIVKCQGTTANCQVYGDGV